MRQPARKNRDILNELYDSRFAGGEAMCLLLRRIPILCFPLVWCGAAWEPKELCCSSCCSGPGSQEEKQ
jgi:hypothetical protein